MNSTPQILSIFIHLVTSLIEGLLGIRFILKLFGASTKAPFVTWVYKNTEPLLNPFQGMFPSPALSGFAIEFSTLVALVVYAIIGYIAVQALVDLSRVNRATSFEIGLREHKVKYTGYKYCHNINLSRNANHRLYPRKSILA